MSTKKKNEYQIMMSIGVVKMVIPAVMKYLLPCVVAQTFLRSWAKGVVFLLIVIGQSPAVLATETDDDGWVRIGSAPKEPADEGWAEVKSLQASIVAADTKREKSILQTNVAELDPVASLELLAAHEELAEPLIIDFGEQGSVNAQRASAPIEVNRVQPPKVELVNNLDMFVGQLLVLGEFDLTRVAIGNGSIVRVEVLKTGELLVIGQQEGSTSLRLWNKDEDNTQSAYNIRVGAKDPETRIRMERMVRLRVRMVEFNKRAIGKLGIDWGSEGIAGPTFAAAGDAIGNNLFRPVTEGFGTLPNIVSPFSTYFGIATDITSKLNFLASNGDAVTLAEPVLSAVNGGQASFLAGGEIPYPTNGENGQSTVEFKEYGVRLQVAPRIDAGGNVRTFVETEISKVDAAVSVNGTPGLLTRRAQTEVNVRSGETIVISGLLSSEESDDNSGIPGLRKLPIIGQFFSTNNKSTEVRELVIFITPEVVEPEGLLSQADKITYERSSQLIDSSRQSLPLME